MSNHTTKRSDPLSKLPLPALKFISSRDFTLLALSGYDGSRRTRDFLELLEEVSESRNMEWAEKIKHRIAHKSAN